MQSSDELIHFIESERVGYTIDANTFNVTMTHPLTGHLVYVDDPELDLQERLMTAAQQLKDKVFKEKYV